MLEDDGGAFFSTTEPERQPTTLLDVNICNTSSSNADIPGAAFDLELEMLDPYFQCDAVEEPPPVGIWNDWTNPITNSNAPGQITNSTFDATVASESILNPNPDSQALDMYTPNALCFGDSFSQHNATSHNDTTCTTTSIQHLASIAELPSELSHSTNSTAVTAAGVPATSLHWLLPQASSQSASALWDGGTSDFWTQADFLATQRQDPDGMTDVPAFDLVQRPSNVGLSSKTPNSCTRDLENPRKRKIPFPADLSPILVDPQNVQRSPPYEGNSRRKRARTTPGVSLTPPKHIITTGLPWQRSCKVSAEISQGTFHTFSISGQPIQHKKRKPYSKEQLQKIKAVRGLKACLNCRRAKVAVSASTPRHLVQPRANVMSLPVSRRSSMRKMHPSLLSAHRSALYQRKLARSCPFPAWECLL